MWLLLAIGSSFLLGFYDLLKKSSLKDNAFIPVLFFATFTGASLFGVLVILSRVGYIYPEAILFVPKATLQEHVFFFLKSIIVGSSWFLAYMALSKLPITIVVPIRATGPFWTVIGAMVIFGERFTPLQWGGIVVVLTFFYIFSLAGKKEGVRFIRNKWIYAIIGATIIGAISGLFDKFLLQNYNRMAVQAWFSIYMVIVLFPFMMFMWFPKRQKLPRFKWRYTIPAIGIVLSAADFLYFYALSDPDSLIGVVSVIRRGSVIIAFTLGAIIFKEGNIKRKALALMGIVFGIILIIIGT
jgi:drug/metabolite transporter (DMT)-like permease